jgi:hypothetical protein
MVEERMIQSAGIGWDILLPLPLLAILGKRRQGHVGGYKRQ